MDFSVCLSFTLRRPDLPPFPPQWSRCDLSASSWDVAHMANIYNMEKKGTRFYFSRSQCCVCTFHAMKALFRFDDSNHVQGRCGTFIIFNMQLSKVCLDTQPRLYDRLRVYTFLCKSRFPILHVTRCPLRFRNSSGRRAKPSVFR